MTKDTIDSVELASETMAGDLLAAVVDEIKQLQDPWQKTSQAMQANVIFRLELRIKLLTAKAVRIIAADGRPAMRAKVESVTFKDGIKAILKMRQNDPPRHDLADAAGSDVMVVLADADQYSGGCENVQPDPDQQNLIDDQAA